MSLARAALLERRDAASTPVAATPSHSRPQRLLRGYLHKTSNTLCGIKGYASLIAAQQDPDPRTSRWARKIIAEVETLEAIYRSVQDVAFPVEGIRAGGDLAAVVDAAVTAALLDHGNLEVRVGRLEPCALSLPAHDLEVALTEILANSAESRADANPVTALIGARRVPGRGLVLRVRDDGPGMSGALAAEAAEPFVTTKEGHVGIGLTRVETIMDIYGLGWSLRTRPRGGTTIELEIEGRDDGPDGPQAEREC